MERREGRGPPTHRVRRGPRRRRDGRGRHGLPPVGGPPPRRNGHRDVRARPSPGRDEDPGEGGRVRRRGQGPVQAVWEPRLAAHAAGLRGVDGPRRPRRGPAPLPARRAHAAARRQRGVAARRHGPGAHQGDEDGRRRPVPDARGHPPGRLRGERRDDDQTRPRDVGRRDAALVPRRDDGQLLRGRRVPRHAPAPARKARRVALAGHAHAQGPVGNRPLQRPGPQTRGRGLRRRPALLALRHRPIDAQAPQGRHGHDAPRRVPRHARVEHHQTTTSGARGRVNCLSTSAL
mmetsp:Transcript_8681/g.24760  ORF Transcript_8681/g.24760 Transcript_8681/m.24760 type:complete len:290 (-) Transcript_8681:49-918(-)